MDRQLESIRIENLAASYQGNFVFGHFSRTLPPTGCVCFFGPSGSGKTTLLQIIAGLKKPSAGGVSMQWAGTPRIAYVFQENRLIPWLTARENISFVIRREDSACKEDSIRIAENWLAKVGLQDAMDKYPSQLSGGMRQRVNIARALAFDAPVILLDEPFKELDDAIKGQIMAIFQELKKDRLVVLVTHDREDALLLSDQMIPFPQGGH